MDENMFNKIKELIDKYNSIDKNKDYLLEWADDAYRVLLSEYESYRGYFEGQDDSKDLLYKIMLSLLRGDLDG